MAEQMIRITSGDVQFLARMEPEKSPQTCAAFLTLLPYEQKLIHVRWSGESCWISLGDFDLGVPFEDATSAPGPRRDPLVPRRHLRVRAAVPVRAVLLRLEGRPAGGQPLPHYRRGQGEAARVRGQHAAGRRAADPLRAGL